MIKLIPLLIFTAFSVQTFAAPAKKQEATITGDYSLGMAGTKMVVTLKKEVCEVASSGQDAADGQPPKEFKITLTCKDKKQVIWDIQKPSPNEPFFDEPAFSILWAGDQDGDGKIDLKMNLSAKYSCQKIVLLLSTKAKPGDLVGASGKPGGDCNL